MAITAVILRTPACLPCIAEAASLTLDDTKAGLAAIGRTLLVVFDTDHCRLCGVLNQVFSIGR